MLKENIVKNVKEYLEKEKLFDDFDYIEEKISQNQKRILTLFSKCVKSIYGKCKY